LGLLSKIFKGREKATTTDEDGWFHNWALGDGRTVSGENVTPETAIRVAAVFACVRVRSEDVAKLPLHLYKRLPGGGKERATKHPLYKLMNSRPNPRQTAFEFRQLMQSWIDLRGNAYGLKEFDGRGQVTAIWPMSPTATEVLITPDGKDLFYKFDVKGVKGEAIPADYVLHLRGPSLDGILGVSPITHQRETIGLALAAQKYGAAFFGNNAQPGGALKIPTALGKEAAKVLRESWEERHQGASNNRKLAIFDGGMEWVQLGMDNTDAQYLETRKFQNRDIYAIYRVPAHKVGDLERSTNNNIEHQGLEYIQDCLSVECTRWEQTLDSSLLTEKEQGVYFFEHLLDGILRGDLKSRYDAYAIARNWGILSVDDIREMENRNPLPDGKGKIYLQPLNMVEAGSKPEPTPAPPAPPAADPEDSEPEDPAAPKENPDA
jgi:HK97 family phage portal protein